MKKRTIMPNGRYTDDELELFKKVFAENEDLLVVVRKVMLQFDLTAEEEKTWKNTFGNAKPLNDLMRKLFLPTIDPEAPIQKSGHQSQIDLWMTLEIDGKMPEEVLSMTNARAITIDYLDRQLEVLSTEGSNEVKLNDLNQRKVDELRARKEIITHVELQLSAINSFAGFKQETADETIKRLEQNSSK